MSLGRHSIANLIGTSAPLLVALMTIPAYLRYIGPERYGVLAVVMALTGYMGFMDLGLGRAVTQRLGSLKDAHPKEQSEVLWTAVTTSFLLGMLGGVVLWFSAYYLLNSVIDISTRSQFEASASVMWVGLALPFLLTGSALTGALHAKRRFLEVNIIQALGGTAGLAIPLLVAVLGYTELSHLLPATLAMRVLTVLLLFEECRKHIPLIGKPSIQLNTIKPLLAYGGWISVMSILSPLLVTVDRLVIAALSGTQWVANYTIPYDIVTRAMVVSGSFSNALFPRLSAAPEDEGKTLANRASATLVAIMTPIITTGIFILEPFLNIWITPDFATNSAGVGEAILIGVWLHSIVVPHYARYLATQSPRLILLIFIFEIPIYFLMLWGGVSHWGVLGAALAWSARVFLDAVLILRLNNVLLKTIASVVQSLLIIVTAYLTIYAFQSEVAFQVPIAAALILLSIAKDHKIVLGALMSIKNNPTNVTKN